MGGGSATRAMSMLPTISMGGCTALFASSRESIDLNAKRYDYEQAGVLAYVAIVIRQQVIRWFMLQEGQDHEVAAGADGRFKSAVFPGLWLEVEARLQLDASKALEAPRKGWLTQEHEALVRKLQSHRNFL